MLPDGTERILHSQGRLVLGEDGRAIAIEGTVQDVTERKRAEEQIRYLAYHDSLTGLGNRRLFKERLGMAVAQARRNAWRSGVLFLDLDHFKRINDTLGHSVGDALLQGVADRLVLSLRESDAVARDEMPSADLAPRRRRVHDPRDRACRTRRTSPRSRGACSTSLARPVPSLAATRS